METNRSPLTRLDAEAEGKITGLELERLARTARARLLQMHYESGVGHIGGGLSCLDTLLVLYHQILGSEDVFILSKGHAAGALYTALWSYGVLSDDELKTFHKENTRLSAHPAPNQIPEVRFATGSLGHGLSLASGVALAKRMRGERGRVYCLLSDGEWQEGSTWEALIFLAHQKLPVTLVIDTNGLQGFGTTQEVASQGALDDKLTAFGIPTVQIDGHDLQAIRAALSASGEGDDNGPRAIVALTRKGCGVSFMENRMEWHYLPLNEAMFLQAREEVLSDAK